MHKVPEGSYVSFLLSPHHNIIGLPGWSVPGSGSGHAAYWRPLETRWMPAGKWARTKEPNLNNAGTLTLLTLLGMCLVHVSSRISAFVTVLVQNVRFIFLQWQDFLTGRLAGMSKTKKKSKEINSKGCADLSETEITLLWAGPCENPGRRSVLPGCWWTAHTTSFFRHSVNENLFHFNMHRPHTPYLIWWPWRLCSLYKMYIKDILGVRTENQQTTVVSILAQIKLSEIIFKRQICSSFAGLIL